VAQLPPVAPGTEFVPGSWGSLLLNSKLTTEYSSHLGFRLFFSSSVPSVFRSLLARRRRVTSVLPSPFVPNKQIRGSTKLPRQILLPYSKLKTENL